MGPPEARAGEPGPYGMTGSTFRYEYEKFPARKTAPGTF
jgi:hypothetical protein